MFHAAGRYIIILLASTLIQSLKTTMCLDLYLNETLYLALNGAII